MEHCAFDNIVGYEGIKEELRQVIDMIDNPQFYEKLGAKLPRGILLIGAPGTGKTTLCQAFMKEAGLYPITLRKNSSDGDFVKEITTAFSKAKEQGSAIILLDDLDKFANEDESHSDAEEYVAVQAGIDWVKDSRVIVLATVNNPRKLPKSLTRAGRFDRQIKLPMPSAAESEEILSYYMADKPFDPSINTEDIVKMVGGNVAAVMESILNDAAIMAGAERCEYICQKHIVNAVLRREYDGFDSAEVMDEEEMRCRAIHEAGHATVALALGEDVGLISIAGGDNHEAGGFIHLANRIERRPYDVMVCLGGKVAAELYFKNVASGCHSDLERATLLVMNGISNNATAGLFLTDGGELGSSSFSSMQEVAVKTELQRYMTQTRNILLDNRELLEELNKAILEKRTLLYSDIQAILHNFTVETARL